MIDRFGRGLMASSAIVAMAVASPAYAQTKSFDVPAQSAQTGIAALGRQADIQIVAARKFTKGKMTNAVRGSMTVDSALRLLLEGTGLTFRSTGVQTYMVVQGGNASGGASGAAQAGQGQAVLVGSVRDHTTGAALKGARVEVVETGDSTSTGDLGDFRFARLPAGDVTLRISYLGFPEQTETVSVVGGFANRADIYLGQGATSEIVVYGQVSARAQALNQERTAENSTTVISGDLLGNFNGTTISDALRRAPGVAFVQDEATGDGTNIIVRGLAPDYNQVKLNGLALPEGTGLGRAPNLSNILADSVSEIKISKTLLASQDSSGTGGLVEIETKSPLDRPKRYFNASIDGTKRAKGYGHEYGASGTASLRFGADGNFGVSASVQYRNQHLKSYSYTIGGIYGPYLPLLPNGQPATTSTLDPRTPFPFFDGADYFATSATVGAVETESETLTASFSAEWQVSDATNLRLDYVNSRRSDTNYISTSTIGTQRATYRLAPVPSLGGAQRYVYYPTDLLVIPTTAILYTPDSKSGTDSLSFRGESAIGKLSLNYAAGYAKGSSSAPLSSRFSLSDDPGLTLTPADVLPGAISDLTGRYVTLFGPRSGRGLPAPLFTPEVFERIANTPLPRLGTYSAALDQTGQSENWTADVSAKYEVGGGLLKYVEAGLGYRRSTFENDPSAYELYQPVRGSDGRPVPITNVGVEFNPVPFATQGRDAIYRLPTRASVARFIANLGGYADDGIVRYSFEPADPVYGGTGTLEEQIVGYVQARADIGKLEIIGGVRGERSRVVSSAANGTEIFDEDGNFDQAFYNASRVIVNGRDTAMTWLPRILLNYRPEENIVVRAGYYSTVARPQISQLTADRFVYFDAQRFYGPTGTQPALFVQAGNPALKPARTHNFDVTAEWYDGNVGVIKLSAYYKRIDNLIESNSLRGFESLGDFPLPDHPLINNRPDDTFVQFSYPVNNPDPARIWGVEAAVERRMTFLPGILSGLGIYANYLYSNSRKTEPLSWYGPVYDAAGNVTDYADQPYTLRVPFNSSPRHSGTVGLTYSKNGFDASLFYTAQARRQLSVANFGMNSYNEAASSLDFRGVYQFKLAGSDVRLSFEALNLLKGASDPNTETSIGGVNGLPKYYVSGSFLGGRKFSTNLSITF